MERTTRMKCEIFIVSFRRDFSYLMFCLGSIKKFAVGFTGVTILVPDKDVPVLAPLLHGWKHEFPVSVMGFDQASHPRQHLHHCIKKCQADQYCPGADYILFLDSDCVFREPVTPDDYIIDERPVLLIESYTALESRKDPACCWKKGTAEVLGFVPEFATMLRHPTVYHKYFLNKFRSYIECVHISPFEKYALSCDPSFPVGFNDFNNLNSYVHKLYPSFYHIIDLTGHPERRPHDKLIQYWSHGPIDKPQENTLDGKTRTVIPIEEIQKLLA